MEINFQYSAKPGLRIIPNVMEGKLIWVRGLNGIGKSLAATIFVIATSNYQFSHKNIYESLRKALNFVEIDVSIDKNKLYKIKLYPEKWEFFDESLSINENTLGKYYFNEEEISIDEFKKDFKAKIVKGNETLSTQIQDIINRNISILSDWEKDSIFARKVYSDFITKYKPQLCLDRIDILEEKKSEIDKLEKEISNLKIEMEFSENNLKMLRDIIAVENNIKFLSENNLDDLSLKLKNNEVVLNNLQLKFDSLISSRDALRFKLREENVSIKNLYDSFINKNIKYEKDVEQLKKELINDLKISQIEIMYKNFESDIIENGIHNKLLNLSVDESNYRKQKEDIFIKKHVRETAQIIISRLVPEIKKTPDEIIAEGFLNFIQQNIEITINDLKKLIESREKKVIEILNNSNEDEVNKKLQSIQIERNKINIIIKKLKDFTKIQNEFSENYEQIKDLEQKLGKQNEAITNKINEIENEIKNENFEIYITQKDITDNKYKIEKIKTLDSLSNLQDRKKTILRNIEKLSNIDIKFIDENIINDYENKKNILNDKLIFSLKEHEINKNELESDLKLIKNELKNIENDKENNFILKNIDKKLPTIEVLKIINNNIKEFIDYLDINIVNQIANTKYELIEMLKFQKRTDIIEEYKNIELGKKIEKIFNEEFLINYNKPEFLNHVFKGNKEITGFDLKNNEIKLENINGEEITRPIAAFSSGEKAFAFAMATISSFSQEIATYKILFLDEFGALLDYMKEDVLLAELKDIFQKGKVSKIVILLPIKSDINEQNLQLQNTLQYVKDKDKKEIENKIAENNQNLISFKKDSYYQIRDDKI
jgi:hypothetical protein